MSVAIQGGLGNQMFIAAYGLSKGVRTFDITNYDTDTLRRYEMDQWGLDIELVHDQNAERGYFQDEKYFHAPFIRYLFRTPAGDCNRECRRMADRILDAKDSCFIGVRRADYLWPERINYHGVMPPWYYFEAFKLIPEGAKIFCFTDDIPWVQDNFDMREVEIVDVNGPNEKAWDIWLGSLCKHAIIGNSTFHWWQAYLGADASGGTVIAPKKWFADEKVNAECTIVPERWVRV